MPGATTLGSEAEQERVLSALRRWGWNATSFQVTKPGFRYFHAGASAGGGTVAYVDTGSAWVAAGAPIAPEGALGDVAQAFVEAARARGARASFFAVERRFLSAAPGFGALAIGRQPVWDPRTWDETVGRSRNLRSQIRRPRAKGVRARLVTSSELAPGRPMQRAIEGLSASWLASRGMAPMRFLVDIHVGGHEAERRYVVAEQGDRLVGACLVVPVYARGGWFLENVLRAPGAPNGTSELLVDTAMRAAAEGGSSYATLGLAPLAGDVPPWLRLARAAGRFLYDFEGLASFKAKLCPQRWDDVFVAHPRGTLSAVAIFDALTAFAGGSLVRFAAQSARRLLVKPRALHR